MNPTASQVWLVVEPLDMRAGIDGLSPRIQNTLGRSPCDGTAYAFRNRRQNRLKLLIWDGTGVWLCQCWRAVKTDQPCSLNFDQAFFGVANYASVDKSTRL